ncbi:MAG TPA: cyclic lactone autoinducer peptide [Ruminococcus sp.]|nr:cyclic lactone autoinducer peptide [Ruminococcus sp.]
MKKLNSIVLKFSSSLAALVLLVGVSSAASACYFWFNQPEMPKAIEKFRKDV